MILINDGFFMTSLSWQIGPLVPNKLCLLKVLEIVAAFYHILLMY